MLTASFIVIALLVVVLLAFSDKLPLPKGGKEKSQGKFKQRLLWGAPIVLGVLGIGTYLLMGSRTEMNTASQAMLPAPMMQKGPMLEAAAPNAAMPAAQANQGGDLKVMVKRLASKMAQDPKNGEGWALLAHTYVELRQYNEAESAFAKAAVLLPSDAKLMADWADAHVVAQTGKWDNQARDLVKRALSADPKNLKALALAGSEAFGRADYPQAIAYWKDMLAAAPANSMHAKLAQANIDEANAMLSGKKPAAQSKPQEN